jgi:hypothetical protein
MASWRPWRVYEYLNTDGRRRSKSGSPLEPSDTEDFLQLDLSWLQVRCRFLGELCLPAPTAASQQPYYWNFPQSRTKVF